MRGQRDAAQKEMEEVGRELRGDDEELRVRFRKGFCVFHALLSSEVRLVVYLSVKAVKRLKVGGCPWHGRYRR